MLRNTNNVFPKVGPVILGLDLDYVKPADEVDCFRDASTEKSSLLKHGWTFHKAYGEFFAPTGLGKFLIFANGFVPLRWLPIKANRVFLEAMGWLNSTLLTLIRERYRAVAEAKEAGTYVESESKDLLTMIAEESGPGGATEGLGETDLLGHLLQLMAAGHDTTANMLSWSSYIMATRPDIQNALRKELETLPADAPYSEIEKLPYLEGFVKESLRLYPPGKNNTYSHTHHARLDNTQTHTQTHTHTYTERKKEKHPANNPHSLQDAAHLQRAPQHRGRAHPQGHGARHVPDGAAQEPAHLGRQRRRRRPDALAAPPGRPGQPLRLRHLLQRAPDLPGPPLRPRRGQDPARADRAQLPLPRGHHPWQGC